MEGTTKGLGKDISTLLTSRDMMDNYLAFNNNMTNPMMANINMFQAIGGVVFTSESYAASVIFINRSGV